MTPQPSSAARAGKPRKLILRNHQSPGDIVMLTAAIRDLHHTFPGHFLTDMRTSCPQLWEHNPYLTPVRDDDPEAEVIECNYPLIHKSNQYPYHFIHGFIEDLGERLGVRIQPGIFKGDIHLAEREKHWMSQVQEITKEPLPFWIIVAGGKGDFTIKWWDSARWQQVVDHFRGKILFVQVGEAKHWHPPLKNVLDLRGRTDLRQLVRLVYHAQGVLSPVTMMMHLAAAVEVKGGRPKNRPCVVVAGGREPSQWEAYPHHQFIHMNGALFCCDNGGCWKSRTIPLGDGDEKDKHLCIDVVPETAPGMRSLPLPRCMDLITSNEVTRRIEMYFNGGTARYLNADEARIAAESIERWTRENPTGSG
jgi:ADP-heptose:LPS heptosyltransferase